MSMDFKYLPRRISSVDGQYSPLLLYSRPSQPDITIHTEAFSSPPIYELFFRTTPHPAIIVDLNANPAKACANVFNPAADSLISFLASDIFAESHLEDFNGTLSEFISTSKRKVGEEFVHIDVLHLLVKTGNDISEAVFNFSAATFDAGNGSKMVGILLIEVSKTVKEEIEAINSFKSSLISGLSHELNNPMNSLMLLLKMMPSSYCEDRMEDLKELALTSAKILQNKIRDIIDYSMIEMNKFKLNQTEFFIDDLFKELKQMFRCEVKMKSNKLVTTIHCSNNRRLTIFGDRNRIEQVLVKLLCNANKFTNEGTITLTAAECKKNFNVAFAVEDTGVGVSKTKIGHLFKSLKQKANSCGNSAKLPGLGLNIAKSICKRMDAALTVVSEEGKGTKFSFEIPVCQISTFEKPLADLQELCRSTSYHSLPALSKTIEPSCTAEERKIDCSRLLPPDVRPPARKLSDEAFVTEITKSVKFKKASSRIFGRIRLNTMTTFKFSTAKESDTDALEENIQVHQIIPLYNGFTKGLHRSASKVMEKCGARETTVLVVDDVYSNRMVLREIMGKMKIPTSEAINGEQAVNLVEASFRKESRTEIALILMDLNMPVMTGIEAAASIRRLERVYRRQANIPIVAVTAHSTIYGKDECIKAGMQDCAAKPITNKALRMLVEYYAPRLVLRERGHSAVKE